MIGHPGDLFELQLKIHALDTHGVIDVTKIFKKFKKYPMFMQHKLKPYWDERLKHPKGQPFNCDPKLLWATQTTVTTKTVLSLIETPIEEWYQESYPWVIRTTDARWWIADGHHRLAAAILLGMRKVKTEQTHLPFASY